MKNPSCFHIILNQCILVLFLAASLPTYSQTKAKRQWFTGIDGGMGVHLAKVESDIPQLNGISVVSDGGTVGLTVGTLQCFARIGAGFFYSTNSPQTIDRFSTHALLNFYPLSDSRFAPYILTGPVYDQYKFAGFYLDDDSRVNYSLAKDSYIGKQHQLNLAAGIGMEYRLTSRHEFLCIFVESRYHYPMVFAATRTEFEQTQILHSSSFQVGFRIGRAHAKSF